MPRLRQVPRAEADPRIIPVYDLLFGARDPVSEPGTATGTPGDWWTVFALAPDVFEHAVQGFALYRNPARKIDAQRQDSARARMAAEDIKPIMDVDHGWCHSHYYLDPNGIMVEFCRDTPGFTPDTALARERLAEQHS